MTTRPTQIHSATLFRTLVLCLLVVSGAPAGAGGGSAAPPGEWFALEVGDPREGPRVENPATADTEIRLDVVVPGFETRITATRDGPRGAIDIPDGGIAGTVGQPRLPALRYMVETPPGADVLADLVPMSIRRVGLGRLGIDAPLVAVQPPIPKIEGAGRHVPYIEQRPIYDADRYFPAESVAVVDRAVLRGRHVAVIEVRPVRYNPVAGAIEVWSRAELHVAFEGGVPEAARREKLRLASPALDGWIGREILAGPDAVAAPIPVSAGSGSGSEGAAGMLVIAHDDFVGALQPFLEWKVKAGFRIELRKTSEIAPDPTDVEIRAEIEQAYATWTAPSLEYVLLVGDTDFVAIHVGTAGDFGSQVTDNWYACVDGSDYLPDLAIARISTRSAGETAAVVDKLLTYERALFTGEDWIKTAGFIGTDDAQHWALVEDTHDWCIETYYTPNGYLLTPWSYDFPSCDRHYFTHAANTQHIASSIEAGRAMVNYSGHGSESRWYGPTHSGSFDQDDVRSLTNDGMYPVVISNACSTGRLEAEECLAETWLREPHRGAIAFWGSSNAAYWMEDVILQRSLHDDLFPMETTPSVGVAVNEAKLDLYDHYGPGDMAAYYFEIYNLLSEPSLFMWTRPPRILDVACADDHPVGESAFPATVTHDGFPVEGALVCVRKPDDGVFDAGYTDGAGRVALLLDPAPATLGPLEVTVTGHDLLPHEGTANVVSPGGPWLVHRSHVVDDGSGGNGDGAPDPGEVLVLPVTVENVGVAAGTGLHATLSTSTPQWCTVLDDSADFPDLTPGEQGTTLPDHYRVAVSELAPDRAALGLDLAWSTSAGTSGVTSFSTVVQGVRLELESFRIDDAEHGNGNGVPGPGETVDLWVTLENVGLRGAQGVTGQLSADSPYVSILQGDAGFPDIPPAGQADSLPPTFALLVAQDAPGNQPVTFTLTVEESGTGYQQVFTFETTIAACTRIQSHDVPHMIYDVDAAGSVESEIDVPTALHIEEVNVFVDVFHNLFSDLTITLVSPSGTSVVLHDRSVVPGNEIVTWYDTETTPAEPLSVLEGEIALGTWKLIVVDHASFNFGTLRHWSLEICGEQFAPVATLELFDHRVDDSAGCDPDGVADIGETVTWGVTVRNRGWTTATGVRVSLATPADVLLPEAPVLLPDLGPNQTAEAAFEALVRDVGCMEPVPFTVQLEADQGGWTAGFVEIVEADFSSAEVLETMEHQGAEPAGWTHAAATGVDDWRMTDVIDHTPLGVWSWLCLDADVPKDDRLVSPEYDLGIGGPRLEFWHYASLRSGDSGGVLEISIDGGQSWADLGPDIVAGGYDGPLGGDNPIAGRDGWTGQHAYWRNVVVDLTPWTEQVARFRWRLTSSSAPGLTGWFIDDVWLGMDYGGDCDNHLCGIPGEIDLRSVTRQGDDVTLQWRGDPLCIEYRVWRASDPTAQTAFTDVTAEDPDPCDTSFLDSSGGDLSYWVVVGRGPEGDGPWGHYGH